MFKKIIKDISTVSLGTLISNILGFIRDVLVAKFFGTSQIFEAFVVAFRLPNLFRSMCAEGFVDSVATPVLSEYQKDKDELFRIANNLICFSGIALCVLTFLGIIFSKYLVIIMAPGFLTQPDKFNLAVSFTRITFLYLLFIGISVNSLSILCVLKKFFISAINPAFLNVAFIAGVLFFSRFFKDYILVVCVLAGGLLQTIFPFISLKKEGFRIKLNLKDAFSDKVIMRMFKLFPPRVWSSVTYHLSVMIDTVFSSLTHIVGEGALSAVWYANRLIHFPLALVALPISSVAIIDLSYYHKNNNMDDFKKLFVFSLQNIIFFIIPISAVFIFMSRAILDVLFYRGEFNAYSLNITSSVFFFSSFGLFFFCVIKLLVQSFYSLKDTRIPAITATISLVINVILSAILMFPLKIGGVALGSSLAAILNCFLLYHHLVKKIGKIDWQDTKSQFIKIVLLSIFMGLVSRLLWDNLLYNRYLKFIIIVMLDCIIFLGVGFILKFKQINYFKERLVSKFIPHF